MTKLLVVDGGQRCGRVILVGKEIVHGQMILSKVSMNGIEEIIGELLHGLPNWTEIAGQFRMIGEVSMDVQQILAAERGTGQVEFL